MMDRAKLIAELEQDEGRRKRIYVDTVGKVSGGVGRNLTDRGFRDDEIDLMLTNDIDEAIAELDRRLPWWRTLDDARARALTNMSLNLGINRLTGFGKMLSALNRGDWETAASEALNSKWASQVGKRAERIAEMFRTGSA